MVKVIISRVIGEGGVEVVGFVCLVFLGIVWVDRFLLGIRR